MHRTPLTAAAAARPAGAWNASLYRLGDSRGRFAL